LKAKTFNSRSAEPDVAERPAALQPHAIEPHAHGLRRPLDRREEIGLLALAHDRARQRLGPRVTRRVEFAEVRHRLLDDLAPHADRTDQTPVGVGFAVLHPRRVAQVHLPRICRSRTSEVNQLGRHYMPSLGSDPRTFAALRFPGPRILREPVGELRKLG
jgi:hypothetical protein